MNYSFTYFGSYHYLHFLKFSNSRFSCFITPIDYCSQWLK